MCGARGACGHRTCLCALRWSCRETRLPGSGHLRWRTAGDPHLSLRTCTCFMQARAWTLQWPAGSPPPSVGLLATRFLATRDRHRGHMFPAGTKYTPPGAEGLLQKGTDPSFTLTRKPLFLNLCSQLVFLLTAPDCLFLWRRILANVWQLT